MAATAVEVDGHLYDQLPGDSLLSITPTPYTPPVARAFALALTDNLAKPPVAASIW